MLGCNQKGILPGLYAENGVTSETNILGKQVKVVDEGGCVATGQVDPGVTIYPTVTGKIDLTSDCYAFDYETLPSSITGGITGETYTVNNYYYGQSKTTVTSYPTVTYDTITTPTNVPFYMDISQTCNDCEDADEGQTCSYELESSVTVYTTNSFDYQFTTMGCNEAIIDLTNFLYEPQDYSLIYENKSDYIARVVNGGINNTYFKCDYDSTKKQCTVKLSDLDKDTFESGGCFYNHEIVIEVADGNAGDSCKRTTHELNLTYMSLP